MRPTVNVTERILVGTVIKKRYFHPERFEISFCRYTVGRQTGTYLDVRLYKEVERETGKEYVPTKAGIVIGTLRPLQGLIALLQKAESMLLEADEPTIHDESELSESIETP